MDARLEAELRFKSTSGLHFKSIHTFLYESIVNYWYVKDNSVRCGVLLIILSTTCKVMTGHFVLNNTWASVL